MYTQSYIKNPVKANVVSFPNKESLRQLKELERKNSEFIPKEVIQAAKEDDGFALESLFVLIILFATAGDESISPNLFQIIIGIMLSL